MRFLHLNILGGLGMMITCLAANFNSPWRENIWAWVEMERREEIWAWVKMERKYLGLGGNDEHLRVYNTK